jgi:hypothetical protein
VIWGWGAWWSDDCIGFWIWDGVWEASRFLSGVLVFLDVLDKLTGDTTERASGTAEIPGVGSNTISVVVDVFIQHDEGLSIPSQNGDGDMQSNFFAGRPEYDADM